MNKKITLPLALALTAAMVGCSSNKLKVEQPKPTPLPKVELTKSLVPVFSQRTSATNKADPLRLQLDADNGVTFIVDPKGSVAAYRDKQKLWDTKLTKHGLTSGITAKDGVVIVGDEKGQLFALDQATGQQKWQAQLTGALLSPSLIADGIVVTIANDGTVIANNVNSGQQLWAYKMPSVQLSLRGQPSPVLIDPKTVLVASANAYIYAIDLVSGIPRFQRRVAVSEGRSDIQRLIDIDGDPVVSGDYLVTTSYQGQVTVLDLSNAQMVWNQDASSLKRPEVANGKVYVTKTDGNLVAYDLATGNKVWENNSLAYRSLSNPVMLGNDLIVGDYEGYLHQIDPSSGQIVGRSKTSGAVLTLRNVNNNLYVATRDGTFTIWQNR